MKDNKNDFFAFLDERKNATMEEVQSLAKDNRKDESNTLKAKANIYDIFKAIWGASERMAGDDFKTDFLVRVDNICGPWEKSLEVAREHNDTAKIVIEEAKLAAVKEIKNKIDLYK